MSMRLCWKPFTEHSGSFDLEMKELFDPFIDGTLHINLTTELDFTQFGFVNVYAALQGILATAKGDFKKDAQELLNLLYKNPDGIVLTIE